VSIVTRGRVVRREDGAPANGADRLFLAGPSEAQRVRMPEEEVAAHENAVRIVEAAHATARAIIDTARADAAHAAKEAAARAAETEQGRLAAAWLALRDAEEHRTARDLDRAVALARLLAERLIGHAVEASDDVVAALATQALTEARGVRSVAIEAHPLDAASLRTTLRTHGLGGLDGVAIDIKESDSLARGSLRVHTDLGTLDARLHPRLERLAAALLDALQPA
jgi:flagellar biosynthesis/type III secretory pathway protein FliH